MFAPPLFVCIVFARGFFRGVLWRYPGFSDFFFTGRFSRVFFTWGSPVPRNFPACPRVILPGFWRLWVVPPLQVPFCPWPFHLLPVWIIWIYSAKFGSFGLFLIGYSRGVMVYFLSRMSGPDSRALSSGPFNHLVEQCRVFRIWINPEHECLL